MEQLEGGVPLTVDEFTRAPGFALGPCPQVSRLLVGTWARGPHSKEGAVDLGAGPDGALVAQLPGASVSSVVGWAWIPSSHPSWPRVLALALGLLPRACGLLGVGQDGQAWPGEAALCALLPVSGACSEQLREAL